jgi:hypothetical protein
MPLIANFRTRVARTYVLILIIASALAGGCGESPTAPKPAPEGQTSPGQPDATGIPKPPSQGGAR